jgi:hypothetical protein
MSGSWKPLRSSAAARLAIAAVLCALAVACEPLPVVAPNAVSAAPPSGDPLLPDPLDCEDWRYDGVEPGPLPEEWNDDDYRFTSRRDPGSARSPQRLCGQLGAAVDLAWGLERGSADVVIAVLDSGIRWRDPAAMADLADNAHLNRGELPVPARADGSVGPEDPHDANRDGRFSASDYDGDPASVTGTATVSSTPRT